MPGLRREELAQLAGVSVDYYVRFEQGRVDTASDAVIDAIASALRLAVDERLYLYSLARPPKVVAPSRDRPVVRPALRQLLDSLTGTPAYVVGHRTNMLAWNRAAEALFGIDFASVPEDERTWIDLVFHDSHIRRLVAHDWDSIATGLVAHLRLVAGHRPDDPDLNRLLQRMTVGSSEFHDMWATRNVTDIAYGRWRFDHDRVGALYLDFEFIPLPADPGIWAICLYSAEPDTPSAAALQALITPDPDPMPGMS